MNRKDIAFLIGGLLSLLPDKMCGMIMMCATGALVSWLEINRNNLPLSFAHSAHSHRDPTAQRRVSINTGAGSRYSPRVTRSSASAV
ncbi:hypothetical protein EVAR_24494_1 [Eumeta japonica]|uniref:Uncharacterized protein n=1 Tax=Eumeta variegata TaxID=151549 RepID=A0A4C1UR79_EUMVA|nr:hypothetical protein EVAR_24494_1 [Eumeta japonica]